MKETKFRGDLFSEHILTIIDSTYHLKHPKYDYMCSIRFHNVDGVLLVTGDYGNWVFCREFVPSKEGGVSEYYWIEKLQINSRQNGLRFCSDLTREALKKEIEHGLEDYGYKDEKLEEAKEFYTQLLDYCDNEHEYIYHAYYSYNNPGFLDSEEIPFIEVIDPQLQCVFNAFNEICKRLK